MGCDSAAAAPTPGPLTRAAVRSAAPPEAGPSKRKRVVLSSDSPPKISAPEISRLEVPVSSEEGKEDEEGESADELADDDDYNDAAVAADLLLLEEVVRPRSLRRCA